MAYQNEATDRARLRRQMIDVENRPCSIPNCPTPYDSRAIHRIRNGCNGGRYSKYNTTVLCYTHHKAEHPSSKFRVGEKVRLCNDGDQKHQTPARLGFTDYELSRPRTIIAIKYDKAGKCNNYKLGSNGKGKMLDGQPLDGYDYWFRSYQLLPYIPRAYHFKRKYNIKAGDSRLANGKGQGVTTSQPC